MLRCAFSALSAHSALAFVHRDIVGGAVLHHARSCCQQFVLWLLLDDSLAELGSVMPELWCRVCPHGDTEL